MLINDIEELKSHLLPFHYLTGFRVSIYNLDFREIFGFPRHACDFCLTIKKNPSANKLCLQSDYAAFIKARTTGKSCLYTCPFGLYEAVVPLFVDGILAGYLMVGQVTAESKQAISNIRYLAMPFVAGESRAMEQMNALPSLHSEKILASLPILEICANQIIVHGLIKPDIYTLPLKIKEFIDNHYTDELNINNICEHTCYSRSYIIKSFKDSYGYCISKYIESKRLSLAIELMHMSNASITEIASECGFNDPYYFSKVFKKVYGCSPSKAKTTLPESTMQKDNH